MNLRMKVGIHNTLEADRVRSSEEAHIFSKKFLLHTYHDTELGIYSTINK